MEKTLILIKHNFRFLWVIIEWGNDITFSLLFRTALRKVLPVVFEEYSLPPFTYRFLNESDADALFALINSQEEEDFNYFKPHKFDLVSIKKQFSKSAFLMMGAFDGEKLVGYFFLRFFSNRKCFVGRLLDKEYRGRGIGNMMNTIMYEIAWRLEFRCLSTISRNNVAVIHAHKKNSHMTILKELNNDYLLVEFKQLK